MGFVFLWLAASAWESSPTFAATLLIDDFEGSGSNKLGGRASTYVMAPSRALAVGATQQPHSGSKCLMLKYDKKARGGPYDEGGWCGYYTLLKAGPRYLNATPFKAITFWVRGDSGGENFVLGIADKHWEGVGDSVKSEEIGKYLPEGRLTTQWQKATVPLDAFMVEMTELYSLAVCFEGSVFPGGAGKGTVYVDDLMLE